MLCLDMGSILIAEGLAGHAFKQAPHPIHKSFFTGLGVPFFRKVMAFTGQASAQCPHISSS